MTNIWVNGTCNRCGESVRLEFTCHANMTLEMDATQLCCAECSAYVKNDDRTRHLSGPELIAISEPSLNALVDIHKEKRKEVEITPEMIEAGFRVLKDSGITDEPLEADRLTVEEIYMAMQLARPC